MAFTLVLGDTTNYLAKYAKSLQSTSYLIDDHNRHDDHSGVVYTSLGDLSEKIFLIDLIKRCKKVIYHPPLGWQDNNLRLETEKILSEMSHYVEITVDVDDVTRFSLMSPIDVRKTQDPQLWCVGCSFTSAVGVEPKQAWPYLIGKAVNKDYSVLAYPGASVTWNADQILRSDIRKGDTVVWGLTNELRFPVYERNGVTHATNARWQFDSALQKLFKIDYFESEHHYYRDFRIVLQIINFCNKIGADLVLVSFLSRLELQAFSKVKAVLDLKTTPYVDLASDGLHPGPLQHQIFAKKIVKVID